MPRKILAANQIFADGYESGFLDQSGLSSLDRSGSYYFTEGKSELKSPVPNINDTLPTIPSEQPSVCSNPQSPSVPETPSRRTRRATVVTRSPEPARKKPSLEIDTSPCRRREKSRSQNDLIRPITPVTKLEFELQKRMSWMIASVFVWLMTSSQLRRLPLHSGSRRWLTGAYSFRLPLALARRKCCCQCRSGRMTS